MSANGSRARSITVPCGATVTAPNPFALGQAEAAHMSACQACQAAQR